MKLSIGAVRQDSRVLGVLYQSTLVSSHQRVPLKFLSNDEALRAYRSDLNLPIVTICNFCAQVAFHNHFNKDRHLTKRDSFKDQRSAALAEWKLLMA